MFHGQVSRDTSDVTLFIERSPDFVDWMFAIGVKLFSPSQTYMPMPHDGQIDAKPQTRASAYKGLHTYLVSDATLINVFLSVSTCCCVKY